METGTVYAPDGIILGSAVIGSPEWKALCEERREMAQDSYESSRS